MAGNRKKTIKEDRRYATFWKDRFPGIKLIGVTSTAIEEVKEELLNKGLANQSVLHYLKFLRHICNLAVGNGKLSRNPFAQVKLPKVGQGRLRFLSLEEEGRLLRAIGPR